MYFFMDPLMFFHESINISIIFFCYILYNPKSNIIPSEKWIFFCDFEEVNSKIN